MTSGDPAVPGADRPAGSKHARVLLKLSGEIFCKPGSRGIDIDRTRSLAEEIAEASTLAQMGIVVGGGNLVRGAEIARHGIQGVTGDYMGMLATVINALALQEILEQTGLVTRVLSALAIESVAEPWIRRRAIRHLEKGRIIILAGGTGNPHFTTDTAAALRATEIQADVLLKATAHVDGVYDSDPLRTEGARRYRTIRYMDVINQSLKIMDVTAISMCMERRVPIRVFNILKPGSLARAVRGESVGTEIADGQTVLAES